SLRDVFRGSLVDEIVRGSGELEIDVILGDEGPEPPLVRKPPEKRLSTPYLWSIGLAALATIGAVYWQFTLGLPDAVVLYLLAIVVAAIRFGGRPALATTFLSIAAYNFFLVRPFFSFAVADARDAPTFAIMIAVGLLVSRLTGRLHRQEHDARTRERRTA